MTNTKKNSPGRHTKFTDAFTAEAVRLERSSGGPMRAIADDLGVGLSTRLGNTREPDLLSGPNEDTAKELARLRKEMDLSRFDSASLNRLLVIKENDLWEPYILTISDMKPFA